MDTEYCEMLANEGSYLFKRASAMSTRQDILVLLRDRAAHWRRQHDLARRDERTTEERRRTRILKQVGKKEA